MSSFLSLFLRVVGLALIFGLGLYIAQNLRRAVLEHEQLRGAAEVFE